MHDVPTNILTLSRAVVASQTAHTLPSSSSPAQAARPTTSANSSLLKCSTGSAIQRYQRTHEDGQHRTEPPTSYHSHCQLPSSMRTTERCQNVRRHSIEPFILSHYVVTIRSSHTEAAVHHVMARCRSRRGWGQCIFGTTSFTIQTVPCAWVARSTSPLFNAEVVHKCHGTCTVARSK